jgi:hypothetical protein
MQAPQAATGVSMHICGRARRPCGQRTPNVVIAAPNVILDCAGYTISTPAVEPPENPDEDPGPGSGVFVQYLSGVTVKNCPVTGFTHGIEVADSTDVSLVKNYVFDNAYFVPGNGFLVVNSSATILQDNASK